MPLLIDGHNVIGQMAGLDLSEPDDEEELVRRVRRYCWRRGRRATIVFDAHRSARLSQPPVQVIFAPDADQAIIGRIRRARDPHGLIVVSSDHEIQDAARRRGARVMEAHTLAARLTPSPPKQWEKPERIESLEEWLRLFDTK